LEEEVNNMPAIYTCDVCGKEDATEDYNGSILCKFHRAIYDLEQIRAEYISQKKWMEAVYGIKLRKMEDEMKELEGKIKLWEVL